MADESTKEEEQQDKDKEEEGDKDEPQFGHGMEKAELEAPKDELKAAEGKLKAAEGRGQAQGGEGKLKAAEGKLKAAEGKLKAAEGKLKAAKDELKAAKDSGDDEGIAGAKQDVTVARAGVAAAQSGVTAAQSGVTAAQEYYNRFLLSQPSASPGIPHVPLFKSRPRLVNFPRDDIGQVLFREVRALAWVASILDQTQKSEAIWSHYFRGAPGSGKTVFLKMLALAFQKRGFKVHFVPHAGELNGFSASAWTDLRADALNESVVLIVDEVQANPQSHVWHSLLRDSSNLLVIGAGITSLNGQNSPHFHAKHRASELLLSKDELPELVQYWQLSSQRDVKDVQTLCEYLLDYTGGHVFPFVKFAEHIFTVGPPPLPAYFLRSQQFSETETYQTVTARCFSSLDASVIAAARRVMSGDVDPLSVDPLDQMALWNPTTRWFLSDLVSTHLFASAAAPPSASDLALSDSDEWIDLAEQIIIAGLTDMTISDFLDDSKSHVEDALGFNWAFRVKQACPSSLHIVPQKRTADCASRVDWYFNGRIDAVVELLRNGDRLERHVARSTKGTHKQWSDRFVLFNFQMTGEDVPVPKEQNIRDRFFTFLYSNNSLYRGSKVLRPGIVRALPTYPSRTFHSRSQWPAASCPPAMVARLTLRASRLWR